MSRACAILWSAALLCCGGGQSDPPDAEVDAGADAAADASADAAATCTPSTLEPRSPAIFETILTHLVEHETHLDGDWDGDFGDATAYAPPVLTAVAQARCDPAIEDLARVTLGHEEALIQGFAQNLSGEALIGGLGLIETYAIAQDPRVAESAGTIVELAGSLLDLFRYLPRETVENAGLPYGQTATTALLVAIELRYVERVDPLDDARLQAALRHIDDIEQAAWAQELGYYRFNEGDDELHLYPNSAMMAVHALAGRLTQDGQHLDRAEALFDAVQPLYRPEAGGFHDGYQGTGDDYISLSTETYFLLALHLLRRERPDARYDEAIETLFTFIEERLYVEGQGVAYHDWEYGARANWYCTGCNFQLLYILLLYGS